MCICCEGEKASPCDELARGRQILPLNLCEPQGSDRALEFVARADVLIEGFRPGAMKRLWLGPDVCLACQPPCAEHASRHFGRPMQRRCSHAGHSATQRRRLHAQVQGQWGRLRPASAPRTVDHRTEEEMQPDLNNTCWPVHIETLRRRTLVRFTYGCSKSLNRAFHREPYAVPHGASSLLRRHRQNNARTDRQIPLEESKSAVQRGSPQYPLHG